MRAFAGGFDVELGAALTTFPGSGHVQGTTSYLHFGPGQGPAAALSVRLSDALAVEFAANDAWPRASISGVNGAEGRRVRAAPLTISMTRRIGQIGRIEPYVGAGVGFPILRHADDVVTAPDMHIARIEQPDHLALVLQAGARLPLSARWYLGVDAKVFPFASTFETHRAENPRHALQTNFHPVVVRSGIGVRF